MALSVVKLKQELNFESIIKMKSTIIKSSLGDF